MRYRSSGLGTISVLTEFDLQSSVSIGGWFAGPEQDLESIEFGDAAVWTTADITNLIEQFSAGPRPTNGDDSLIATHAFPIVSALDGDDQLTGWDANVILDGGAGNDVLTLRQSAGGVLIGGAGGDQMSSRSPATVVAFNRGDGFDRIAMWSGTISLGGGIRPDDIHFSLSGEGLVLSTGGADQLSIVFNPGDTPPDTQPVVRLQIVSQSEVELYDLMAPLFTFFARVMDNPDSGAWVPESGWSNFLLSRSIDSAVGGAIAYAYGTRGSTADISSQVAQQSLETAGFGVLSQQFAIAAAPNEHSESSGSSVGQGDPQVLEQGSEAVTPESSPIQMVDGAIGTFPSEGTATPNAEDKASDNAQAVSDDGSSSPITSVDEGTANHDGSAAAGDAIFLSDAETSESGSVASSDVVGVDVDTSTPSFSNEVVPASIDVTANDVIGLLLSEQNDSSALSVPVTQLPSTHDQNLDALADAQFPMAASPDLQIASSIEGSAALLAKSPSELDRSRLGDWYAGSQMSSGADEIVGMQAMLDAARQFGPSANSAPSESSVPSSTGIETGSHDDHRNDAATMLDHWSYTNALINFHLSGAELPELGSDIAWGHVHGSPGFGAELAMTSPALAGAVVSELQSLYGQLRPFAGIQEGLATLG